MFYKQFLKITDLNKDFVEAFDYWLTTLPRHLQNNITASAVSARMGVSHSVSEAILVFAMKEGILEKHYIVKCPECGTILEKISKDEMAEFIGQTSYCDECEDDKYISTDSVYVAYKVVKRPDATEEEILDAIEKRLHMTLKEETNFCEADSLSNSRDDLYEMFYNPDESAYTELECLRNKLDEDYGSNTTLQGAALEKLVLRLFTLIKGIQGTTKVKTETNQFDCTLLCGVHTVYPSVFQYLTPYFIAECKNEKKKPDNTYLNKLESIMDTNEAQVGIVFGRLDATKPCFQIAREHYLTNKKSNKQQIIITCCDKDLDYLIGKRVNILKYLEYKIFQVTGNSPNATYEMFFCEEN